MRVYFTVIINVWVLLGCDQKSGTNSESPAPEEHHLELTGEPVFSVSESSEEPMFQLFNAWSGAIVDGETVAVGNHGTQEVIFFDYEGRARKVVGGMGSGPGEFQAISGLFVMEGGLGVWDGSTRRLSRFSPQGAYLGSIPSIETGGGVAVGVLNGARLVTISGLVPGEHRQIAVWDEQGEVVLDLEGPEAPPESLISWTVSTGEREMTQRTSIPPGCMAYADETVIDETVFALVDGLAVQALDSEGTSWEVYRAASSPRLTEAHLTAVRRLFRDTSAFSELDVPDGVLESALRRIGDIGDPLPAWVRMRPDPSGRLWLERGECGAPPDGPATFDIVDVETGYVATVVVPEHLRLLSVREEWALLLRRGALDVEHVELYELR